MSSIAVTASASGTGTVSLVAPVTNSDRTITLPDETGTLALYANPQATVYTSGSGTYTVPTGAKYLTVKMAGVLLEAMVALLQIMLQVLLYLAALVLLEDTTERQTALT